MLSAVMLKQDVDNQGLCCDVSTGGFIWKKKD
jgi:hypothetical protein